MEEISPQEPRQPPALEIDLSPYLPLFEDDSIGDADKMKLLEALWSIIISFARIGWGVHPVQQAQAARRMREIGCGQGALSSDGASDESEVVIESDHQFLIRKFLNAAEHPPQKAKES